MNTVSPVANASAKAAHTLNDRKFRQENTIRANIHIVEATRNKLRLSFSELYLSICSSDTNIEDIYKEFYPHVNFALQPRSLSSDEVRKNFVASLLKDTTLDPVTIGSISNVSQLYNYAINQGIWPKNRDDNSTVSENHEPFTFAGSIIEVKKSMSYITSIISRQKKMNKNYNPVSTILSYIHDEQIFFESNKDRFVRELHSCGCDDLPKMAEILDETKNEIKRHVFVKATLMAMLDEYAAKI